jgi:hypothetical protein
MVTVKLYYILQKKYNYKEIKTLLINHDRREKLKLLKYV